MSVALASLSDPSAEIRSRTRSSRSEQGEQEDNDNVEETKNRLVGIGVPSRGQVIHCDFDSTPPRTATPFVCNKKTNERNS